MTNINRRTFLCSSAGALAGSISRSSACDRVRVAILGLGTRGALHVHGFARAPNVEVCALCDVNQLQLRRFAGVIGRTQRTAPEQIPDYRAALDRKDVDAVAIALPDRLRAVAVCQAVRAGKHVLFAAQEVPGMGELRELARESAARRCFIEFSSGRCFPVNADPSWRAASGRTLVAGSSAALLSNAFAGLEVARRALGVGLPSRVSLLEVPDISLAMSFAFRETGGQLQWESRRAPGATVHHISVAFEGAGRGDFLEWTVPVESAPLVRPSRERFHNFAQAVRMGDPGLLALPISEARLTAGLLRLAGLAGHLGREVRFEPGRELLAGSDQVYQPYLG